jgi:hypothetical protein
VLKVSRTSGKALLYSRMTATVIPLAATVNKYMSAVDKLRPQSKPFSILTKDVRKKEAEKLKKYDSLKNAWDTYEDTAQDKPDPEDLITKIEATDERVIDIETAVNASSLRSDKERRARETKIIDEQLKEKLHIDVLSMSRDRQEYAEEAAKAAKAVRDSDGSDDNSEVDDDEWDLWILEAKRLKAEAEINKAHEDAGLTRIRLANL